MKLSRTVTRRALRRAFTLMEVLVVVAIIVVLAGIATVSFRYLSDSKYDAARAKMKAIEAAAVSYKAHTGQYPASVEELAVEDAKGEALLDREAILDPWGQEYVFTGQTNRAGRPQIQSNGEPGKNAPILNWTER